ncbi:MAG: HK97 family phage prohead protease [Ehrlichia sp.]
MIENDVGLYVTATLLLDLQKGKEAYLMLKNGIINALSIGYTIIDDYVDMKTGLRVLKKISLWEISLVTFPANVHSKITDVKDIRDSLTISISNAKSALDKLSSMTDL